MSDFDAIIAGTIVTERGVVENGYVAVTDGIVTAMGTGRAPETRDLFDFGSALVLPGAIDGQAHSRSQTDQEDFGAGHDAAFIARIAPAAMIFVPSRKGKSHGPEEWTEPEALARAADVLLNTLYLRDRA